MKSKAVASIMRHVASKLPAVDAPAPIEEEGAAAEDTTGGASEEARLEKLYEQVGWPLGKIYGHPYDAFKLALTCVPSSFPRLYRRHTYTANKRRCLPPSPTHLVQQPSQRSRAPSPVD